MFNGSIEDKIRSTIKYSMSTQKTVSKSILINKGAKTVKSLTIPQFEDILSQLSGPRDCLNYSLGLITSRRMAHGAAYMVNLSWKKPPGKIITGLHKIWNIFYHSFHLRCHKIVSRSHIDNSDCHKSCHNPFQEYQCLDHYLHWNIARYLSWWF